MVTSLTSSFNYEDSMIGIVMGDTPVINQGESLRVRIPVYMPNIPTGKPEKYSRAINAMGIYKNDPSCRPALSSHILKEQNFLTAKMYPGEDIENIVYTQQPKSEKFEPLRYIKDGERVSVSFSNGKMRKIYFETTIYK